MDNLHGLSFSTYIEYESKRKEEYILYPFDEDAFSNRYYAQRRPGQQRPSQQPGFPGGFPGSPGGFPGGGFQPPTAPPPNFTPQQFNTFQQQEFSRRGGIGGIRRCMFHNTFMWMRNGNSFWFFPVFVSGNQIVGFRWRGTRGWVFDSINRNNVLFFQCY